MTKIRPYLIAIIGLLLLAGPWLLSAEFAVAADEPFCDCCQGPCQGCCCAVEVPMPQESPDPSHEDCRCDITGLPAVPELPLEVNEYRVDPQPLKARLAVSTSDEIAPDSGYRLFAHGDLPPSTSSPPAYLMFGALLI